MDVNGGRMSASLSQTFVDDLARIHATLRPQPLPATFISDLTRIHATLLVASDVNLQWLADSFQKWRATTTDLVKKLLVKLPDDDPLRCPISLFRTMDYGRLETAHTRTLAWLFDPKK